MSDRVSVATPAGLQVRIKAERRCCAGHATIGDDFSLICTRCGKRCGRISQRTAEFVLAVSNKFGTPAEVTLRRGHYEGGAR